MPVVRSGHCPVLHQLNNNNKATKDGTQWAPHQHRALSLHISNKNKQEKPTLLSITCWWETVTMTLNIHPVIHPRHQSVSSIHSPCIARSRKLSAQRWTLSHQTLQKPRSSASWWSEHSSDLHRSCIPHLTKVFSKAVSFHYTLWQQGMVLSCKVSWQFNVIFLNFKQYIADIWCQNLNWFCFAFLWWLMSLKQTFFHMGWWDGSEGKRSHYPVWQLKFNPRTPRTHMIEGQKQLPKLSSASTCPLWHSLAFTRSKQTNVNVNNEHLLHIPLSIWLCRLLISLLAF